MVKCYIPSLPSRGYVSVISLSATEQIQLKGVTVSVTVDPLVGEFVSGIKPC